MVTEPNLWLRPTFLPSSSKTLKGFARRAEKPAGGIQFHSLLNNRPSARGAAAPARHSPPLAPFLDDGVCGAACGEGLSLGGEPGWSDLFLLFLANRWKASEMATK